MVVIASVVVFLVYTQDRVRQRLVEHGIFQQRLPSRSLTLLFRVIAEFFILHRRLPVCRVRQINGFFALFPEGKKVRRWVRTRGRNCSAGGFLHGCSWCVDAFSKWLVGNFWARTQKFGGLGEGWDGALVMRQPTTTFGRISSCFLVLCARAVRTWNLVHYFLCPRFWQSLFWVFGCCSCVRKLDSSGDDSSSWVQCLITVDTCSASVLWWLWKNLHSFYVMADSFPEALLLHSV